jgi:hypothetical protein
MLQTGRRSCFKAAMKNKKLKIGLTFTIMMLVLWEMSFAEEVEEVTDIKYVSFLNNLGLEDVKIYFYNGEKGGRCDFDFNLIFIFGERIGDTDFDEVFLHEAAHLFLNKSGVGTGRGHENDFLDAYRLVIWKWKHLKTINGGIR